jgi:murein DD-endopeptidase MepM/ murein hydrolase activator NlpD
MKYYFVLSLLFFSCSGNDLDSELKECKNNCPLSDGFDFPVGKPDCKNYYNAQKFGANNHLGEDWNGNGGGDTDLGDPVFSCSNGVVVFAGDLKGGWGNVVRVLHNIATKEYPVWIESVYAHLDKIDVEKNQILKRGDKIGTIGTAHGKYKAHLHLEIRDDVEMEIGPGYSRETKGYLNPTDFIKQNRILKVML